ncbi:MAG: hypothetical protein SH808_02355 [Saprospiraceae bacterium]|nr:hypothetical protein [Saprospiraceae bacterium]
MEHLTYITQSNQVRQLAGKINIWSPGKKTFKVQFSHLSEEANQEVEKTIARHYSTCGCHQGRVAGIFTFIGYIILVFSGIISVYSLGIGKTILLYFLFSFVIMLIAKIVALLRARRALLDLATQLENTST